MNVWRLTPLRSVLSSPARSTVAEDGLRLDGLLGMPHSRVCLTLCLTPAHRVRYATPDRVTETQ